MHTWGLEREDMSKDWCFNITKLFANKIWLLSDLFPSFQDLSIAVLNNYMPVWDYSCRSFCLVTVSFSSISIHTSVMKLVGLLSPVSLPTHFALVLVFILALDLCLPVSQASSDSGAAAV